MKTIELPDYLADALIATGKELATQNNRSTAWPVWYVTEEQHVYTNEYGDYEHKVRRDSDMIEASDLCVSCRGKFHEDEDMPDDCDDCSADAFLYYNIERGFTSYGSQFFLTEKACQEYIDANAYHFTAPQPYAASMFRNHEMQPIVQALILMAGAVVPGNHYGVVKLERRDDGTGSDMWPEVKNND